MELYNQAVYTSDPFLPSCSSYDVSVYGSFGSGEVRLEAELNSNDQMVWVKMPDFTWNQNKQSRLQLNINTRYRVVIDNCADVSIELNRGF